MSEQAVTMGDKVARDGSCEAFVAIADLAQAVGRLPIGEWAYGRFGSDDRYQLWVNGGPSQKWTPEGCSAEIDRFYAYVEFNGWPAAVVCPAGGTVSMDEGQLIDAITREVAFVCGGM